MSFWDPKYLEEQRKRRMEDERRRRLESEAAARRREAARQQAAKKAKLAKAKKLKEREEEEAERRLRDEAEGAEEQNKPEEPFVPPVLNRGFGFAPGPAPMNDKARSAIAKNEVERQKKALEEQQSGGRSDDSYSGPKLPRPF